MPTNILMPALSPTMEKGKLAKWLKKEGDRVSPGDVIAEIETDKATMEVESIDEGTLGKIVVPEGTDDVAVNSLIGVLLGEGENAAAIPAAAGKDRAAARRPCRTGQGTPTRGRASCRQPTRRPRHPLRQRLRSGQTAPASPPRRSPGGWPRKKALTSEA